MQSGDGKGRGVFFKDVLKAELEEIGYSRKERLKNDDLSIKKSGFGTAGHDDRNADVYKEAHDKKPVGLAFSGGGIRSATFNLGVLQALAEMKLLRFFDYLSTVSGGGYIGGWLAARIKREGAVQDLEDNFSTQAKDTTPPGEHPSITFLRRYSNYLTPKTGFFSADTWAAISTYLRNLSLNLTILTPSVLALLITPVLVVWLFYQMSYASGDKVFFSAAVLLATGVYFISLNLSYQNVDNAGNERYTRQGYVLLLVVMPVVLSALTGSFWLWFYRKIYIGIWPKYMLYAFAAYAFPWVAGCLTGDFLNNMGAEKTGSGFRKSASAARKTLSSAGNRIKTAPSLLRRENRIYLYSVAGSAAVGALLVRGLYLLFSQLSTGQHAFWYVMSFGMPLMVLVFMGTATAQIGLMGSDLPDEKREWWSRLGGWLCIFMLAWIVPFGFVLTALPLLLWGKAYFTAAAATGWLFSTLSGVWSGKSPLTGKGESGRTELIARIAPYVFAFGLLLFSAAILFGSFIYENVAQLNDVRNGFLSFILTEKIPFHDLMLTYLYYMNFTLNGGLLIFFLSCLVLAVLLSCRLDINQFSMHLLYRNRLTRCYLGASNKPRNPQPFTGLDPGDDFPISELSQSRSYFGPYPVINSTLNLVGSRELAWQTRKAVSFVSTPHFCGYELPAEEEKEEEKEKAGCYRVTKGRAQNGRGVLLGEAMTVSGAAASPNMGYHSSPPLAFLMTIFNVRLGWWVRNTRYGGMENKGPKMGLRYLMAELFGLTDNESGYVYLSDGGHFENLGIYELVRRRCNVIVASDASCDPNYTFEDLGNAIRKIRVDLGIPVEIDLSPLRPGNNSDRKYCAVGTIHYKCVDGADVEDGKLIYIKPLLTGINEPADVSNYASLHKDFPHQSTADQWFDESQFESYRMLGYHSVKAIVNYSPLSDDANEGLKMLLQGGRSSFSVRHDFL